MEKSTTAYIGAIATAIALVFGTSIGKVISENHPTQQYDHNAGGVVDMVDVSIGIDDLTKTVDVARVSMETSGVYETTVSDPKHMYSDINADGQITEVDLSLSMEVTEVLMRRFGYADTTATMSE